MAKKKLIPPSTPPEKEWLRLEIIQTGDNYRTREEHASMRSIYNPYDDTKTEIVIASLGENNTIDIRAIKSIVNTINDMRKEQDRLKGIINGYQAASKNIMKG